MHQIASSFGSGLPDAEHEPEFYEGVPTKRFVAWVVDVILILVLTVVTLPLTAFLGLFFFPLFYFLVGFFYRWVSLARWSATPGMLFAAIALHDRDGAPLDEAAAFLHTAGYAASIAVFPVQMLSVALMLITPRRQGLSDLVLGTAALRRYVRG
jgi:uncharacterized RDD family membrane protein YckC